MITSVKVLRRINNQKKGIVVTIPITIVRNLVEWDEYLAGNEYDAVQNVPPTPPSYPVIVWSSFMLQGDWPFMVHTFLTVEEIEKPGTDDYHREEEALALMQVAEQMYSGTFE